MSTINYPRISISYCTQCKWLLRAAYFAQELLSTFPTLGEVSLHPTTGGTFTIEILDVEGGQGRRIWDRKEDGGFPDVKVLKRVVRDVVEPGRGLGHVDGLKGEMEREEMGGGKAGGCVECFTAKGEEEKIGKK